MTALQMTTSSLLLPEVEHVQEEIMLRKRAHRMGEAWKVEISAPSLRAAGTDESEYQHGRTNERMRETINLPLNLEEKSYTGKGPKEGGQSRRVPADGFLDGLDF